MILSIFFGIQRETAMQCRRGVFGMLSLYVNVISLSVDIRKPLVAEVTFKRRLPGRALRPAFSVSTGLWFLY